jgi:triosephosphate isomerase (TIM)
MRKKIVAGNWKMNKTIEEGISLISEIIIMLSSDKAFNSKDYLYTVLSPPYILLNDATALTLNYPKISVAAQNCYSEEKGAFTGEISAPMIKSTGADHVIIGHSERRTYFKEDNQMLAKKVNIALKYDLTPIFCCGELLEQRNAGNYFSVIKSQLEEALFSLKAEDFRKIIIAYEPIWAIGTGVNATPQQAQEMHQYIRSIVNDKYGKSIAEDTTILYGGSCNSKNAAELFANPDVDGGLIGGASLIAEEFVKIIDSIQ